MTKENLNKLLKDSATWQRRLHSEYIELVARLGLLHKANIKNSLEKNLTEEEQQDLVKQEKVMSEYKEILERRMTRAGIPFDCKNK